MSTLELPVNWRLSVKNCSLTKVKPEFDLPPSKREMRLCHWKLKTFAGVKFLRALTDSLEKFHIEKESKT